MVIEDLDLLTIFEYLKLQKDKLKHRSDFILAIGNIIPQVHTGVYRVPVGTEELVVDSLTDLGLIPFKTPEEWAALERNSGFDGISN